MLARMVLAWCKPVTFWLALFVPVNHLPYRDCAYLCSLLDAYWWLSFPGTFSKATLQAQSSNEAASPARITVTWPDKVKICSWFQADVAERGPPTSRDRPRQNCGWFGRLPVRDSVARIQDSWLGQSSSLLPRLEGVCHWLGRMF